MEKPISTFSLSNLFFIDFIGNCYPLPPEISWKQSANQGAGKSDFSRSGLFTTGIVSVKEGRKIAVFFSGRKHAGENLEDLLQKRQLGLGPPIQMCDALSRNLPKKLKTIEAHCLSHARRKFVDVVCYFPDECRYLIEALAKVYHHDVFHAPLPKGHVYLLCFQRQVLCIR